MGKIKGSLGTAAYIEQIGVTFKGSKQQRRYEKRSRGIDNPCMGCRFNQKGFCSDKQKWISNVQICDYFD